MMPASSRSSVDPRCSPKNMVLVSCSKFFPNAAEYRKRYSSAIRDCWNVRPASTAPPTICMSLRSDIVPCVARLSKASSPSAVLPAFSAMRSKTGTTADSCECSVTISAPNEIMALTENAPTMTGPSPATTDVRPTVCDRTRPICCCVACAPRETPRSSHWAIIRSNSFVGFISFSSAFSLPVPRSCCALSQLFQSRVPA